MNQQDRLNHPVSQFLDAVTMARRPVTRAEIDELAETVTASEGCTLTASQVRRRVSAAVRNIEASESEGDSGRAREIARDAAAKLADELGPFTEPPRDLSAQEIVDSIPRKAF